VGEFCVLCFLFLNGGRLWAAAPTETQPQNLYKISIETREEI